MKYVFFGTPRFAEIILGRLIEADMAPAALVCNPDRPAGRKKVMTPPLTKQRAVKSDATFIDILQPEVLDENFIKRLKAIDPDFFVVAAYAKIIPQTVLDIPRLGTLGVHPSLLPKYRGASPIQSVILHGEHETGAAIYLMDQKMDHGPILASERLVFDPLTTKYADLQEKLAELSADLLIKTVPSFLEGKTSPHEQDHSQATFTKKFVTDDAFIDEKDIADAENGDAEKARMIVYKINAFDPEPGAWTMRGGKRIKLISAKIADGRLIISLFR